MTTIPRSYQIEIRDAKIKYLQDTDRNGIIVSPTGTGKSLAANMFVKWALEAIPGSRIMVTTHDRKIIGQNCQSLYNFWPQARAGIFSSGLKQWDTTSPILYTGIQSVYKCAHDFGHIDCLIVDECHMVGPKSESMYGRFIMGLRKTNPDLRIFGYSATPYRLTQGMLTEGDLFDDIVIDLSTTERFCQFVDEGYLSPLVTMKTEVEPDLSNVPMQMGDFNERIMEEVVDTRDINHAVAKEVITKGAERNFWLGFCTTVHHAENLCAVFRSRGISAEVVHGKMSEKEQDAAEERFRKGQTRCLLNCGMYNVGWDFDALDLIFVVRGTQSPGWWVQCLGRGTRPVFANGFDLNSIEGRLAAIKAGRKNRGCLVLDFCGNTRRLGPINAPCIPKSRRKGEGMGGDAPVKVCKNCGAYNATRATVCVNCEAVFPPSSCIERTASRDEVFIRESVTPIHEIAPVSAVSYTVQDTKSGAALRIGYMNGLFSELREHWFVESPHEFQRRDFRKYWTAAGGTLPYPETAEEARDRARKELKAPKNVEFESNSKWKKIVKREYETKT